MTQDQISNGLIAELNSLLQQYKPTFSEPDVLVDDEHQWSALVEITFGPYETDDGTVAPEPVTMEFQHEKGIDGYNLIVGEDDQLEISKGTLFACAYFYSQQAVHAGPSPRNEGFVSAVRDLVFKARTSGGTAGRDDDLCKALDVVENWLNSPEPAPATKPDGMEKMPPPEEIIKAAARAAFMAGWCYRGADGQTQAALFADELVSMPYAVGLEPAAEPVKLKFPASLRKMWAGREVQDWLDTLPPMYEHPQVSLSDSDELGQVISDFFAPLIGVNGRINFDPCSSYDIDLLVKEIQQNIGATAAPKGG